MIDLYLHDRARALAHDLVQAFREADREWQYVTGANCVASERVYADTEERIFDNLIIEVIEERRRTKEATKLIEEVERDIATSD